MLWYFIEQILKIIAVCFCGFCYAVDDSAELCAGNCINHDPVLLSDTESTDRLFRCVVVHRDFPVIQEHFQVFLLTQRILEVFPCLDFLWYFLNVFTHPREIGIHQWPDAQLVAVLSLLCRKFFKLFFFPVDCLDHG